MLIIFKHDLVFLARFPEFSLIIFICFLQSSVHLNIQWIGICGFVPLGLKLVKFFTKTSTDHRSANIMFHLLIRYCKSKQPSKCKLLINLIFVLYNYLGIPNPFLCKWVIIPNFGLDRPKMNIYAFQLFSTGLRILFLYFGCYCF